MTTGLLAGRLVVVTGGSMGIGLSCAEEALREGAAVVIAARGDRELSRAAQQLASFDSGRIFHWVADVTDLASVGQLFDRASEIGRVDGVVHAAGIYGPIGPLFETVPDQWAATLNVNLFGTYLVAREACRRMAGTRAGGSIVLLAGGGAGAAFPNYSAYACTKVAIVRLAETLALEMATQGIRINALAPGFVHTRLHEQTLAAGPKLAGAFYEETRRRLQAAVSPRVAARAATFLLSDQSAGITGRFLAAPYDDWERWPEHVTELKDTELFTLRRVTPRDRGKSWQ